MDQKVVVEGARLEQKIGLADDDGAAHGAISFRTAVAAALEWGRQQYSALEGRKESGSTSGPTVRSAIEAYVKQRKARSEREGANAEGRLKLHVLSDKSFAETLLAKLRSGDIEKWRERATSRQAAASEPEPSKPITPATMNRLLNDLRAALNAAVEKHRRELPAATATEIKIGTRAVPTASNARKQVLTDQQVARIIAAAFEVDEDGDFGRLVLVAAATGARHSQTRQLTVGDLQPDLGRIMVPGALKGRAVQRGPAIAVPLSADVIKKLTPCIEGRSSHDPLLTRWSYRRAGRLKWEKDQRRAWGNAYEIDKPWAAALARAELPADTVMYALRHTSIVRGLRNGLPVRLVAALHDTSSEMIERHYAAFIVDATEELARRAVLAL